MVLMGVEGEEKLPQVDTKVFELPEINKSSGEGDSDASCSSSGTAGQNKPSSSGNNSNNFQSSAFARFSDFEPIVKIEPTAM